MYDDGFDAVGVGFGVVVVGGGGGVAAGDLFDYDVAVVWV